MGSYENPLALYNAYRNIKVTPFGSHALLGFDVHEYRNNEESGSIGTAEGLKTYQKMYDMVRLYGERITSSRYWIYYPVMKMSERRRNASAPIEDYIEYDSGFPMYNVFVGKGAPEDIAKTIKLAVAFGLVEGTVAAIQNFCDKNIGIDCSGFASNYFGLDAKSVCNTGASKMAPPEKRVRKLEDVKTGTAIVFKSGKHVALVDKVTQRDSEPGLGVYALNCMVAESTADKMVDGGPSDGLNYTEYVLLVANNKTDPTMFNIMRPLQSKNAPAGVYEVKVHLANW